VKTPRLFFLGAPRFEIDGKPIELTAAKSVALLTFLAVSREPQSRDRVLGLLWAESASDAARKNLRNMLWSIRKALGEDAVTSDDDHLALGESTWVDVRELEQFVMLSGAKHLSNTPRDASRSSQTSLLRMTNSAESEIPSLQSAIDLYRAPLLDGLTLSDAPDFEIWLTTERERLAQLVARALDSLVKAQRANNDWRAVIETATRALTFDNLQEPMHRALMEAHARLGERAEALRQYDTLSAALERELGVKPLPETDKLRQAIIDGSEGTRPSTALRSAQDASSQRAKISRAPFVGRVAERAALDEELAAARQGRARIALLVGELGIGKSRLWKEWSSTLANATILETRCLQSTQTLPFAPIIELFNNRAVTQQLLGASSVVAPIWLAQVGRLIPELHTALPNLPALSTLPADEERQRLFEALTQCLLALGTSPLVIFVDDVHWADRATLDMLDYLAHRLQYHPLLLVAAYRNEDASTTLVRLIAGWGREGFTRRISLARLTLEQSAQLIQLLGGNAMLALRAQTQSAGNPYFLIELYRAKSGDIPSALNDLVRTRIDALPETARQVVQAAAILDSNFDFAILRRTSGRGEEETLEALDTLIGANILVERDSQYDFAHPLVATIVRDGLSSARRAFLHRRAAEAIEATHTGRLAPMAASLAEHYAQSNDATRAAHFSEIAAEHALALASPNEAADFYRRAIELHSTPTRRMGLGRSLLRAGELLGAQQAFSTALGECESMGDQKGAARAALNLAETYYPAGRFEEATHWMEKALMYLGGVTDPEGHALAHLLIATNNFGIGKLSEESKKHLRESIQIAEEHDLPQIGVRAQFVLGNVLAQEGDLAAANQAYRQTIMLGDAAGDDYQQVLGYNNLAYHSLLAGDLETARKSTEQGLALAESRGLRLPLQYLYSTRGEIALAEKNWDAAEDWFKRGIAESEAHGNREQSANYRANLGLVARGRGDLDGALVLFEQARQQAAPLPAPHLQTQIDLWLTELYLERGERAAANETLTRAENRLKDKTRASLVEWAERLKRKIQ